MNHGTRPLKKDKRDFSFHRTFGSITTFPDNFNVDSGLTMPDQEEVNNQFNPPIPAYPYGCTNYSSTELCIDEDGVLYRPDYTESKVHANENRGADIRESLGSICFYGVQEEGEATSLAILHKRSAYFNVEPLNDYFDGIRSAILTNKRSVSVGTPWFREWSTPQNGVIPSVFVYDGNPNHHSWHNWCVKGWRTINGKPYLIGKTWQGKGYGDNGWAYFSRETINTVMQISGTAAFTVAPSNPQDIKTIRIGLLEQVIYLLKKLLRML